MNFVCVKNYHHHIYQEEFKMKILGFYISRTDWEKLFKMRDAYSVLLHERIARMEVEKERLLTQQHGLWDRIDKLERESYVFTDKQGKLRFKHNGQFAPDNRSKFKRVHDQLRKEIAEGKCIPSDQVPHYDDIKKAVKLKEFGE